MSTGNWARYVNRIKSQVQTGVDQYRSLRSEERRVGKECVG